MPVFEREGGIEIHYETEGSGFPVLLIAPGGMRSAISYWQNTPWNPIEQLVGSFEVVAMDQRNAGASKAPVTAADGWHSYTADQLGLMDDLGHQRFAVAGMCIGGPYCMGLVEAAPERVAAAVLFQPIGLDDNRQAFYEMFDSWAEELRAGPHSDVEAGAWEAFRSNMYDGDFLFNVDRDFVGGVETPLLVLRGNDLYHPASTSEEIARLAPNAELIAEWKDETSIPAAKRRVSDFLTKHAG